MASSKREDEIDRFCNDIAKSHCKELLDLLADRELDACIGQFRTAFISYIEAFQNAFRLTVERQFESHQIEQEQEPWHTNYVTLKPLSPDEVGGRNSSGLKAKAHKITKKACVLFNNENEDQNQYLNRKTISGPTELYAKCIKESQVEWTKPEAAQESTKTVWLKCKLRLLMLSAGALIEIELKVTHSLMFRRHNLSIFKP